MYLRLILDSGRTHLAASKSAELLFLCFYHIYAGFVDCLCFGFGFLSLRVRESSLMQPWHTWAVRTAKESVHVLQVESGRLIPCRSGARVSLAPGFLVPRSTK